MESPAQKYSTPDTRYQGIECSEYVDRLSGGEVSRFNLPL